MSLNLSLQASFTSASDSTVVYEDYAELLRTLFPGVRKIGFYDQSSCSRWSSDGIEASDLAVQVGKVLLQAAGSVRDASTTTNESGITHVVAVRGPDGLIRGAMVLVIGRRKYGRKIPKVRPRDMEVALAPVLRILGRAWGSAGEIVVPQSPLHIPAPSLQHDPFVGAAARASSAPVVLRRALSNAVEASACAFGALIAAERQFTMVNRGNDSLEQAEMREVVDALRGPIGEYMQPRNAPMLVPQPDASWVAAANYKLAICPMRNADGRLAAVLVLFRRRHERDFDAADCACLTNIAMRISRRVLDELQPLQQTSMRLQISSRQVELEPIAVPVPAPVPVQQPVNVEPTMEQRLRTALREDGFDLHAQSITSLRNHSDTARYEVLLRLREHGCLQLPETFLEAADSGGLFPEIDRWVVGRLLKAVKPHVDALHNSRWEFALNVSAASLQRKSFGDFIETQLFRSTVPPRALVFEFSEQDVLAHRPMFENLAPRLAALGCRVALDNCRQGLDIFLSIADLPVHRLKIDAALTHHLTSDTRAAHAVRELVEVASDVGIETVGEHVEDESTREMLRELGIDFAQGFNVAQPRPLMELLS